MASCSSSAACSNSKKYSYKVAGPNLFGQWFTEENTIEGFQRVSMKSGKFDLEKARLVQVNWTYNIFELDGIHYISGYWGREEKQLSVIPFPNGFPKEGKDVLIVGNDHYLHIYDSENRGVYVLNLKHDKRTLRSMLPRNTEEVPDPPPKRVKKNNQLMRAMMKNKANILMLVLDGSDVKILTGIHPSLVDIDHVRGTIIDVQCGYEHYMLLTDIGTVYTWGDGKKYQLGHGRDKDVDKPREVRALAGFNIKKIVAGGWHTAVVSEFNNLYMWGWNDVGQLGIKTLSDRKKELQGHKSIKLDFHRISSVVDVYDEELNTVAPQVLDVSCGTKHTVIMLTDYSIWAAGSNEYGQLGLPLEEYTHCEHYVKVHQGTKDTVLKCGAWTTVIEN